jgi:hypothetical protein
MHFSIFFTMRYTCHYFIGPDMDIILTVGTKLLFWPTLITSKLFLYRMERFVI